MLWVWVLIAVGALGLGLGLHLRPLWGGVYTPPAPTPPNAPVLSDLSSGWTAGENPPRWDTAYDGTYYDPDTGEGDQLRLRYRRTAGGAWTTATWVPFDLDLVLPPPDGGWQSVYPFLTDGTLFAAGYFEVQAQAVRDLGLAGEAFGAWSNSWIDTLVAGGENASSWATATGANKSQYVTVGGTGNRTATGQAGFNGAPISVRSSQSRAGKRQFGVELGEALVAAIHIGIDDGTDNFGDQGTTNFSRPGGNNSSGVTLKYPTQGGTWEIAAGATVVQSGAAGSPELVAGDGLFQTFDTAAGTAAYYLRKAGVVTQLGTTVTGLAFPSYYANCGFEGANSLIADFDNTQNRALDSGYTGFDNL